MKPAIYTLGSALMLAACVQATPDTSAVQGSPDSRANKLKAGMSQEEVTAVIGAPQAQVRSTLSADLVCYSYVYDETLEAKYVHAKFVSGLLSEASDGHELPCDLD